MTHTNWRLRAACRYSPPETFHPTEKNPDQFAEARALCNSCPVLADCLAEALATRDVDGFRAGHTGEERKRLLPKRVKAALRADQAAEIVRLGNLRWAAPAIALRLGVDAQTVWRVLKAHREQGAAA
jgi:WhiB family transcriptional regulator, redox-sensing transcriptional regulator